MLHARNHAIAFHSYFGHYVRIVALVANSPVQERGLDRPETAVIGEVLIVETEDSESASAEEEQESEPSGPHTGLSGVS
jgi:hypothetical protein